MVDVEGIGQLYNAIKKIKLTQHKKRTQHLNITKSQKYLQIKTNAK